MKIYPINGTNTFAKLWIYPEIIIQNNSIPSSCFELFCINWVMRKLSIIPRHVDSFMLHIFYVLNVIMVVVNFSFYSILLIVVSLV